MAGVRTLTIHDIPRAKKLSDAENWNQTAKDWEFLITAPGNVGLAYSWGDNVVATATAMTYGTELAWIGMVLVDGAYRGKGLSKILMSALLDELKSFRLVKLDATPAGQPVYHKYGFKNECLIYRLISEASTLERLKSSGKTSAEQVDAAFISEIINYDKQVMGFNRAILLEYLFREYPQNVFILKKHNTIEGYAICREGSRFCQVGPVVAENEENARELIAGALKANTGKPLVVDVPQGKEGLIQWLKKEGFTVQRSFMRMHLHDTFTEKIPEKYFLIAGPEFG